MLIALPSYEVGQCLESIDDFFYEKGWSDGLPIVPPTEDRVVAMVSASGRDSTDLIGVLPVTNHRLDVASLAVNAVMAGCRPEHFRALIATMEALMQNQVNIAAVQATTHPAAPLAIFSGAVVRELEMNDGSGVFGPGNRALAVIGRAVRLVLVCVGGGVPGRGDQATHGHPGKYTYAIAESSRTMGWSPLHERIDGNHRRSAVSVIACEAPRNVNDHGSMDARGILGTIAGTLSSLGFNNIHRGGPITVILGPEHAEICRIGGHDPSTISEELFDRARVSLSLVSEENLRRFQRVRPDRFSGLSSRDCVPVTTSASDIIVAVAGGAGRHSMVLPSFGISEPAVQTIREPL